MARPHPPISTPHGRFLPLVGRPGGRGDQKGVILPPNLPPDLTGETPSGDAGIQFETDPQSGGWLAIQTTSNGAPSASGIHFETTHGFEVEQSTTNSAPALRSTADGAGTSNTGIFGLSRGSYAGGSTPSSVGVAGFADAAKGNVYGGSFEADSGPSSTGTDEATGVRGLVTSGGSASESKLFGGFFDATLTGNADAIPFATGVRGTVGTIGLPEADSVAVQVGGWFAATSRTAWPSPLTDMLQDAAQVTGVLAFAQSINADCAAIVADVYSSGGSAYIMRAYVRTSTSGAGTEIFQVDSDGNLHIPSGATVIADL